MNLVIVWFINGGDGNIREERQGGGEICQKTMRACRWLCIPMRPMLAAEGERRCVS